MKILPNFFARLFINSCLFFGFLMTCSAVTRTWDNDSGDGKWSTAANWSENIRPVPGDDILFSSISASNCTADVVSNNLASITLAAGYFGTVTFRTNAVAGGMILTVTGDINVHTGNLVFAGDPTAIGDGTESMKFGAGYTIQAANVTIDAGASMNADNNGFAAQGGPGGSTLSTWGGSYGGRGGVYSYTGAFPVKPCYGSEYGPTALGSGGNGNRGGGAIKLIVSGTATINGRLSASSTDINQNTSLGSGGSVWITGGTLAGTGVIAANGGTGGNTPTGGGGGRLDISSTVNNFGGSLQVLGGKPGRSAGLAGSIVLPQDAGTGLTMNYFVLSNSITFGNSLTFTNPVVVTNGGILTLEANTNENVHTFTTLTVASNGAVQCKGNWAFINAESGGATNDPYGMGITLMATSVTVRAGGSLNATGGGFIAGGPGRTLPYAAAYGGKSGLGYNNTYGPLSEVTALGSGGTAGYGGGALKLVVTDTLTVDGASSSDGALATWNYSAGSGGSLWIDCQILQGSGWISANGGRAANAEGGGGGRVYLVYDTLGATNPVEEARIVAYGGYGYNDPNRKGGAGTVWIRQRAGEENVDTVIVKNDLVSSNSVTRLPPDVFVNSNELLHATLKIEGYGRVSLSTNMLLKDMFLLNGSPAYPQLYLNGFTLDIDTPLHDDWGNSNWIVLGGGRIIWRPPPSGTVFVVL